jgi:hypothetical protein
VATASAEHRLVGALAAIDPSPAAIAVTVEISRRPDFNWRSACDLAARNAVLPAVAFNVGQHPELDPSPEICTQLGLAAIAARTCCATSSLALAPVFERWTREGVCWALMKGAALIASISPPDSRMLNDVDVLVAPEDYPRARAVLMEAGFGPATGSHSEETMLALKEQVVFANDASRGAAATRVDLHRQVYGPSKPYRFNAQEVLSRRSQSRFCGAAVYVLDPTDLLLHLATQLLNDRLLVKLLRLADLSTLLARVDPGECERRAAAARSEAALATARAAVGNVFRDRAVPGSGNRTVDERTSAVVRALVARDWPWASGFESGRLPETYRTAAAAVAERGFSAAITDWLQAANDYRIARRASGANAIRSLLGGARMSAAGLAAFGTLRWELRGADR